MTKCSQMTPLPFKGLICFCYCKHVRLTSRIYIYTYIRMSRCLLAVPAWPGVVAVAALQSLQASRYLSGACRVL